jgi:chitin synthase
MNVRLNVRPSDGGQFEPRSAPDAAPPQAHRLLDVLQASHGVAFSSPTIAFCVTLYNEPQASLRSTLASLLAASHFFHRQVRFRGKFSTICIIADGLGHMNPGTLALLSQIGLLEHGVDWDSSEMELYSSVLQPNPLLRMLDVQTSSKDLELLEPVRFLVCLKRMNRGKLQSHSFFFEVFCRDVQPIYCFQVDSGTTLAPETASELVRCMEESPAVGALAARVMPAVPSLQKGFLALWQYADFAWRKAVLWPFEVATGHLSVVPGQASMIRWRALQFLAGQPGRAGTRDPVQAYLRGNEDGGSLNRVMYLAEDRVIGSQIVLAPGSSWELGYAPGAAAVTDACQSLGELLRQRRRWNNSGMASRVWLAGKWYSFLRRSDRSAARKWSFSLAMLVQLTIAVRDFLIPALFFSLLSAFCRSIWTQGPVMAGLTYAVCGTVVAAELLFAHCDFVDTSSTPWWVVARGRMSARLIAAGLFVASSVLALPTCAALFVLAPAAALFAMRYVFPVKALPALGSVLLFPLPSLLMCSILSAHAMWNIDDVSWGTKGLTRTADATVGRRQLRRVRNYVFASWVIANALAVTCTLTMRGWFFKTLNPVLEVGSAIDMLMIAGALVKLRRWSRG